MTRMRRLVAGGLLRAIFSSGRVGKSLPSLPEWDIKIRNACAPMPISFSFRQGSQWRFRMTVGCVEPRSFGTRGRAVDGLSRLETGLRRPTEKVFMFTKQRQYFYDPDPIREPLVRPYATSGQQTPGSIRGEMNRDFRVYLNPMGRNAGSVWTITPSSYRGNHPATMPLELVRRCLLASCPEGGRVLDCFGGAGTTALAALQLGHTAISIDIKPRVH